MDGLIDNVLNYARYKSSVNKNISVPQTNTSQNYNMDDTIQIMKNRNRVLKSNLREFVNDTDESTEHILIKQFINEDKENHMSPKQLYFNNLKEQVKDIKNTEYGLPSKIDNTFSKKLPNDIKDEKSEQRTRNQEARSFGYKEYTPTSKNFKDKECKASEEVSELLSERVMSSPKSNLLINKVLHQGEIIEELRKQLHESKSNNSKLIKKNDELNTLFSRTNRAKDKQIENLEHELSEIRLNSFLNSTVENLQHEISKYQKDIQRLNVEFDDQLKEIAKLNNALRDLTIKLLIYKNKLNLNERINQDLRDTYNNLKFLLNRDLSVNNNQYGRIQHENDTAYDIEEDSTTEILINGGTTNQLIRLDYNSIDQDLDINKLLTRRGKEFAQKSLKSYILAILFTIRIRNNVNNKEIFESKIHNLTDNS